MAGYPPIKDYAAIGDCRSLALIAKDGSCDWMCWPRFDSPSVFGALLDRAKGGRFRIGPARRFTVARRYLDSSNVLETRFTTETGVLSLIDCMPLSMQYRQKTLAPEHELLRMAQCIEGQVEIGIECDPRPGYGSVVPKPLDRGPLGMQFEHGADLYTLRSGIPLLPQPGRSGLHGHALLRSGERVFCSFSSAHATPAVIPTIDDSAGKRIAETVAWWKDWIGHCPYQGPFQEAVLRSMLVLKLLIFAPSGAIIAAGTSSLPEEPAGALNWDYRFCWLRDSAMTLRALFGLGYRAEGEAFFSWLIHATRLTQPELQVLYDVYGESRVREQELDRWEGYAGARPVRIGNAAHEQLQLDVYGEVMRAAAEYLRHGGRLDRSMERVLKGIGSVVLRRWREPDEGIWEIRGKRRLHTYSKAMCWVAVNELLAMQTRGHIQIRNRDLRELEAARNRIRDEIESRGYDRDLKSYVSVFDTTIVDASLLIPALYGYCDPTADRMKSTNDRILEHLGSKGLLYRYGKDFIGGARDLREGAFGICSFWEVSFLARSGRVREAEERMSRILTYANDLGLFAEEIDPGTGEALGNFPQAFTHVGLIDAALSLSEAARDQKAA